MREGEVIAARFAIRRRAGSGAMGTVYEAFDSVTGTNVALKTWRTASGSHEQRPSRLWREARALAEIEHPAVVRYVDHGQTEEHGPFLAMSWVPGQTLAERLLAPGVSSSDACRLVGRLASGLAAMHGRGVVHRDLKPSNIMLPNGDVGQAVIVDFGIAAVLGLSGLTATGAHLGTPRYMAPEQIRNARTVDGRADVFALGCILFECLTGRPAFDGADPVSVLASILFEPLPVPSAVRPDLPKGFDLLLSTMMAREVDKRPAAGEVGELLRKAEISHASAPVAARLRPTAEDMEATRLEVKEWSAPEAAPPSLQVGNNAVVTAVRRAFPPQAGKFVGRESELLRLASALREGTRVVTVWGGPGIGKTRLVLEAVRRMIALEEAPWDALIFADLSDARDSDDIVRILAREGGVIIDASSVPEIALGRALGKLGRVLLVVDPAEHLVTPLLAATQAFRRMAPALQVLATSRSRFCPPEATAIELGPLPISTGSSSDAGDTQRGALSPAAEMFLDRAAAWLSTVREQGSPSLAEQAERLAAALDGIPLAIELCATRVHLLGIDGLLARVTKLDPSPGAMTAALSWSWNLLTAAEQSAFAQCAVFRGGFTIDAAEAVLEVPPSISGGAAVIDLIQSLRDKSLLYSWSAASANEVRLSMFAPVREFAWQKVGSSGELAGARARHAAHYGRAHASSPAPTTDARELARLEREAENLLAAAEYALGEEGAQVSISLGLRALLSLEPAMLARGAHSSFLTLLEQAARAAAAQPAGAANDEVRKLGARVRQVKARLQAPAGGASRASARAELELALDEAKRTGDEHWQATLWLDLGVVHHFERSLPEARRCYEKALALLASHDDVGSEARCIGNLGAVHHDEGELEEAARSYRQAIALLEPTGELRQRANLLGNLAVLEQELGHAEAARDLYERAVALLEPLRDARVLAILLGNFGVFELEVGAKERALALFQRSLALLAGSGDARSQALCHGRLGATLALLGRIDEAEARLFRGERLARAADALVAEAVTLARAFVDLANADKAIHSQGRPSAEAHLAAARRRVERVLTVSDGAGASDRSLRDRSDDIRATLRLLLPALSAIAAKMADEER